MRTVHKNRIFELLDESGLNVDQFSYNESANREGKSSAIISLKNSKLQFEVVSPSHNYTSYTANFIRYAPHFPTMNMGGAGQTIDFILIGFKSWLKTEVKPYIEDVNTVDLWEQYKTGAEFFVVEEIQVNDLSFFTKDEQARIAMAVADFKQLIPSRIKMTDAQLASLNNKLDYLVESSKRVAKTDWKGIVIGIVASIIIALSLDTERGRMLWQLFSELFSTILLLPNLSESI